MRRNLGRQRLFEPEMSGEARVAAREKIEDELGALRSSHLSRKPMRPA